MFWKFYWSQTSYDICNIDNKRLVPSIVETSKRFLKHFGNILNNLWKIDKYWQYWHYAKLRIIASSLICAVMVYRHLKVLPHKSHGKTIARWVSAICFCKAMVEAHFDWHLSQVSVSSRKCSKVKCWFSSTAFSKCLSHWSHLHSIWFRDSSEGWSLFTWVWRENWILLKWANQQKWNRN